MQKRTLLSLAAVTVFIILAFIFLKGHIAEFKNIFNINLKYVALILILSTVNTFIRSVKFKILLKLYGVNLVFKEWFGLTYITALWNYLTPFRAGMSVMAIYLKKKHNLPYTSSVSLTGILYLAQFFIFGLIGIFLAYKAPISEEFRYSIILVFTIIFLVSILMLFFIPLPIRINIRILKHLANSISEFKKARNFSFMLKMIVLDVFRMVVMAFSFYFAFKAFNFNAPIYGCMLLAIFLALSLAISLTPMGLGVNESLIIITSKLMGADVVTGTFVAALDRAVSIIVVFILAPIFSYLIFKKDRISKKVYNPIKA